LSERRDLPSEARSAASGGPVRATVRQVLPNRMFRVEAAGARLLRAHLAGGARAQLTRLVPGDEVLVEISPVDQGECRIVGRPRGARGR